MKRAMGRLIQLWIDDDLLHFGDDENWLSSMVGEQPDDLDFALSERHGGFGCRKEAFG